MGTQFSAFMQALESRRLLSGTVHVNSHGLLAVNLDGTNNTVTVGYTDAVGTNVQVDVDGIITTIPQTGADAQVVKKLLIHCGAGTDTVTITPGDNGATIKEWEAPTTIRGGGGGDTITTGNENDLIFGGAGHDSITAGNGNDAVFGGSGQDTIVVGTGNDFIFGGGTHTAHGGDSITAGGGNDTIFALAGDDVVNPGNGANLFVYAGNGDTVNAGTGDDRVFIDKNSVVEINGTASVKHVTGRRADAAFDRAYLRAIHDAVVQANQATNF